MRATIVAAKLAIPSCPRTAQDDAAVDKPPTIHSNLAVFCDIVIAADHACFQDTPQAAALPHTSLPIAPTPPLRYIA